MIDPDKVAAHLDRLANSLRIVDLQPGLSIARIGELANELVSRNDHLLRDGDEIKIGRSILQDVMVVDVSKKNIAPYVEGAAQ